MSPRSTRRDFLQGKSAARAVQSALDGDVPEAGNLPQPQVTSPNYLVQVGRQAMACEFEVFFNAGQYQDDTLLACEALDCIDELEAQLSVYQEESEVSVLNRTAFYVAVPVEEWLFELIDNCRDLSEQTDGAFDLTAGPLTKVWGFFRRQGQIPSESDLQQALKSVGMQHVQLDRQENTIRFDREGVELNFGAVGKGYALDRAAEKLLTGDIIDFLIHGGQSSLFAHGTQRSHGKSGWQVGIGHPLRRDKRLANINLCNRGLGTSGAGTQFFRHEGKKYGHILDPRTGQPAEQVLSVSVTAPSAWLADALSTAFYVLGVSAAQQYCQQHPEVAALFTLDRKSATAVDVETMGFAEGDLEILSEPIP